MQLRSLVHLVEAVNALAHPQKIIVLGSSSLLAEFPELGESGQPLEISYDADLLIEPCDEETAAVLHEAVGEGSLFHRRHAIFADILRPDIVDTLPDGWASRLHTLAGGQSSCLDSHDLALVKLSLGREKDIALVADLLRRSCLNMKTLRTLYRAASWNEHRLKTTGRALALVEKMATN